MANFLPSNSGIFELLTIELTSELSEFGNSWMTSAQLTPKKNALPLNIYLLNHIPRVGNNQTNRSILKVLNRYLRYNSGYRWLIGTLIYR